MSEYQVYIKMPSYLRQWFIHRHGGSEPVKLIKGSIESKLLKIALVKQPENVVIRTKMPDEVAVCIPYSKARDARTDNVITGTGKRALIANGKSSFDVDCWNFLHDFRAITMQQKDLIYLYMEQHGIIEDGSCWDSIAKNYQRLRKNYLTRECKHRKKATRK